MRNASYAKIANGVFPKKDQAIIIDAIEEVTIRDYLLALAKLIPSTKISHSSCISNSRIFIYLDTKERAEKLIEENKSITIKDKVLSIQETSE